MKDKIIAFCEVIGSLTFLATAFTIIWVIWDLSRLPLQVLGTEIAIISLCYIITKSYEE